MMNIVKGILVADDWGDGLLEKVGEYWTSINDYYVVCISYMGELLSMDKARFSDWLQLHHLLYEEQIARQYEPYAFDPMDVGMDVE